MFDCFACNRLNTGEYIQMVTALVLQLIQCVVVLPTNPEEQKDAYDEEELEEGEKKEVSWHRIRFRMR